MANREQSLTLRNFGLTTATQEDWYNQFLVKVSKGEQLSGELQVSRVDARMNAVEIRNISQPLVCAALIKIIEETFTYFAQEKNHELIGLIVDDLVDHCRRMSPVEVIKAIKEGRRLQGDLYGKLSARNFMKWISEYEGRAGEEIAQYRRNQSKQQQKALEDWDITPLLKPHIKKKREYSHDEKLQALNDQNISPEEKARRDYSREWTIEKGDFKKYMANYDNKATTN